MGVPSPWAVAAAVVAPVVLLRGVTNKGKKSSSGPKKNRFVKIKSSSSYLRFNYDQELTSVRQFAFFFFSSPFSSSSLLFHFLLGMTTEQIRLSFANVSVPQIGCFAA